MLNSAVFLRKFFTNILIYELKPAAQFLKKKFHLQSTFYAKIKRTTTSKMDRFWQPVTSELPKTGLKQYRLLSYNILAQNLLTEHLYLYADIDIDNLKWDNRLNRLKYEIRDLCPDVLCLQEMQFDHLKQFVRAIKGNRKLEYVFKKKTGARTDGCAIIYDKDKFKLIDDFGLELYTVGHEMLNRENVALMAKFVLRQEPNKQLVIATTHLLYNPKRDDVRDAQVEKLICQLESFSRDATTEQEPLPVILTGDFNCERSSSTFALLTATKEEEKDFSVVNGNDLVLQPLGFGDYNASTFQDRWIIVDYILCSVDKKRQRVKIWQVYKLPSVKDCQRCGVMPNRFVGSDHFSLAIKFSVS